ncbi:MAG: peptidylprolyl isomerase [Actinomycetota bacterium]|nr:peptidylprolyl isomerase [Actinomycetota bacterium]
MRRAALVLCPLLLAGALAACGDPDPVTPQEKAQARGLPAATGGYGDKPKVTPQKDQKPATRRQSAVLVAGKGRAVAKGDLLVADYLGQVYGSGKVFDNSYDRGQPAAFPIGAGQVIPGWDKTLVGVKAGSRVLMVLPPAEGYGKTGNEQAGIKGTDTLVFVVDVIASYGKGGLPANAATAVPDQPKGLPTVKGELGARPTLTVPKGVAPPKQPTVTVLAKGGGSPVVKNRLAVVQFEAVDWTGKPIGSTWQDGVPQPASVGAEGRSGPFDELEGVPVGSRVLLTLPAQKGATAEQSSPGVAVVIDVLAQHGPAKEKKAP